MIGEAVAELREDIDTKLRFKKTLMGYDTAEVDDYFRGQKSALDIS
jgi:DivIVA domain-containing protein